MSISKNLKLRTQFDTFLILYSQLKNESKLNHSSEMEMVDLIKQIQKVNRDFGRKIAVDFVNNDEYELRPYSLKGVPFNSYTTLGDLCGVEDYMAEDVLDYALSRKV